MNEHSDRTDVPDPGTDPTTDRLRGLAAGEIPEATRTLHLHAMRAATAAAAPAPRREKRFGRLAVALAAIVGFLAGSTGLAMAGALGPAQGPAADVLSVVGLDVPAGKDGKRGPCVSEAAKLEDEVEKQAAKDECPKGPFGVGPDDAPGRSGEAPGRSGDAPGRSGAPVEAGESGDPCRGKPPWVGNHDLSDAEVAEAKTAREGCDEDAEDD